MSAQAASIGSLLSTLLLSDYRVLRLSWETPFTQQLEWSSYGSPPISRTSLGLHAFRIMCSIRHGASWQGGSLKMAS